MANMPSGCWEALLEYDTIIAELEKIIIFLEETMTAIGPTALLIIRIGKLRMQVAEVTRTRATLVAEMAETLKKKTRVSFAPTERLEQVRFLSKVRPRADAVSTEVEWMEALLDDDRVLEVVTLLAPQ
jgi:hypothetical protein